MKCISWNVNGIRACITKGFEDRFRELDADIFCLQEDEPLWEESRRVLELLFTSDELD